MGLELTQYFDKPTVLRHPGGHYIPSQSDQKAAYIDFLKQQLKNKQSAG